jgi:hypothetical protein
MTVARIDQHGDEVEDHKLLELPAHSRISADIERNTNDILTNGW